MFKIITILFSVFLLTTNALRGNVRSKRDFPLDALGLGSGAQESEGQADQFLLNVLSGHKSAPRSAPKIAFRKNRQDSYEYDDYSSEEMSREELKTRITELKIEIKILEQLVDDELTNMKKLEKKLSHEEDWKVEYF